MKSRPGFDTRSMAKNKRAISMRRILSAIILTLLISVSTQAETTAFLNVNVIPMDRERVWSNQTVIVSDGVITQIGDARRIKIPKGARKIDGTGKYLIPGLV